MASRKATFVLLVLAAIVLAVSADKVSSKRAGEFAAVRKMCVCQECMALRIHWLFSVAVPVIDTSIQHLQRIGVDMHAPAGCCLHTASVFASSRIPQACQDSAAAAAAAS